MLGVCVLVEGVMIGGGMGEVYGKWAWLVVVVLGVGCGRGNQSLGLWHLSIGIGRRSHSVTGEG